MLSCRLAPLRWKQRRTARVGDEIARLARLALVRQVRAGGRAPLMAGTDALFKLARLQSISPAACRRAHRQAACQ